jgi:hypothetical protein
MTVRETLWPRLPAEPPQVEIPMPEKMPGADDYSHYIALARARHERAMAAYDLADWHYEVAKTHHHRLFRVLVIVWVAAAWNIVQALGLL